MDRSVRPARTRRATPSTRTRRGVPARTASRRREVAHLACTSRRPEWLTRGLRSTARPTADTYVPGTYQGRRGPKERSGIVEILTRSGFTPPRAATRDAGRRAYSIVKRFLLERGFETYSPRPFRRHTGGLGACRSALFVTKPSFPQTQPKGQRHRRSLQLKR